MKNDGPQVSTACNIQRFRWDEDDLGHHCHQTGPHEVHTDREHGCRWIERTAGAA